MTTLRKKIEKKSDKKYIQTYIGVGYKMIKMNDKGNEKWQKKNWDH